MDISKIDPKHFSSLCQAAAIRTKLEEAQKYIDHMNTLLPDDGDVIDPWQWQQVIKHGDYISVIGGRVQQLAMAGKLHTQFEKTGELGNDSIWMIDFDITSVKVL